LTFSSISLRKETDGKKNDYVDKKIGFETVRVNVRIFQMISAQLSAIAFVHRRAVKALPLAICTDRLR